MSDSELGEVKRRKVIVEDDEDDNINVDVPEQQQQLEQKEEEPQQEAAQEAQLDDLFGDDDEDEEPEDDSNNAVANDNEENSDEEGYSQFAVPQSPEPKQIKVGSEDIVRHPPKFATKGPAEVYDAKIPKFFKVNPVRFDGTTYLNTLKQQIDGKLSESDKAVQRLIDENTIRWRFTKQEYSQSLKAESNAQIIEWEDGSLSLKLGDEIFDVLSSNVKDTYLTTQNSIGGDGNTTIHLVDGVVSKSVKFVPTSTNSTLHKKLASAKRSRTQQKSGAQSVVVDVDPEKEARRLEKLVEEQIREKRRQALKLEKEQERSGSAPPSSGAGVNRFMRESQQNHYEDEDEEDFVDYDEEEEIVEEEEEEEADESDSERLKQIKQDGAAHYNEEGNMRKKRRVISDDEDDD